MEVIFAILIPDANFWVEYTDLWENSQYQSSFQAPHFLKFLVLMLKDPFIVLRGYRDEKLIGVTCFYKPDSAFHFPSDMKADHNYFILHKDITKEETKQYFNFF